MNHFHKYEDSPVGLHTTLAGSTSKDGERGEREREGERETDRQTDRQTDRETDRQTDRQRERVREREEKNCDVVEEHSSYAFSTSSLTRLIPGCSRCAARERFAGIRLTLGVEPIHLSICQPKVPQLIPGFSRFKLTFDHSRRKQAKGSLTYFEWVSVVTYPVYCSAEATLILAFRGDRLVI